MLYHGQQWHTTHSLKRYKVCEWRDWCLGSKREEVFRVVWFDAVKPRHNPWKLHDAGGCDSNPFSSHNNDRMCLLTECQPTSAPSSQILSAERNQSRLRGCCSSDFRLLEGPPATYSPCGDEELQQRIRIHVPRHCHFSRGYSTLDKLCGWKMKRWNSFERWAWYLRLTQTPRPKRGSLFLTKFWYLGCNLRQCD